MIGFRRRTETQTIFLKAHDLNYVKAFGFRPWQRVANIKAATRAIRKNSTKRRDAPRTKASGFFRETEKKLGPNSLEIVIQSNGLPLNAFRTVHDDSTRKFAFALSRAQFLSDSTVLRFFSPLNPFRKLHPFRRFFFAAFQFLTLANIRLLFFAQTTFFSAEQFPT